MKRTTINLILDWTSYVLLLGLIATGLLLAFVLLPGSRGGRGLAMLGMTRHEWGDIHFYVSMTFVASMVLHLFMHWNWIVTTATRYITKRTSFAFGFVALLSISVVASPFLIPLEHTASDHESETSHESHAGTTIDIKGWMTVGDIEASSGVSVEQMLSALSIDESPGAAANQQAGRFLREQGYSMNDLRDALSSIRQTPEQHDSARH